LLDQRAFHVRSTTLDRSEPRRLRSQCVLHESKVAPGSNSLQKREVKVWYGERLATYKALTGDVVFMDVVPKNPSGKILKQVLKEMAKKELYQGKPRL